MNVKKNLFSTLFLLGTLSLFAQKSVIIPIETANNALVLRTDDKNRLNVAYFGKKLAQSSEYAAVTQQYKYDLDNSGIYHNAYTPSGTWNLVEPALQITHADGNLSTELNYVSHETTRQADSNVSLTSVVLKDPIYGTQVTLYYKVYARENTIEQWTTIKNQERSTITLNKYASANLHFTADKYFLKHFNGTWGQEMRPETEQLTHGIKVLDSKLGTRANLFEPPSFELYFDKPATEDEGKVLLGTLAWSGNFKMDFELSSHNTLRMITGINPHASEYPLAANAEFKTPSFIYTYSEHGEGEASRNMQRWARKYRIFDGEGSRLTLLNNWEATYFDFDEKKLANLFVGAKKMGVDFFLLDDGWFGNKYPRNDDHAGLGDWQENKKKLPSGIGYLVKEAQKVGTRFGIWVELEMVNPKSELYEKHPDWVIKQPQRPEVYYRNQLVLDVANPEVQDYIFGVLDDMFTKNSDLAYIKWDCNAVIYNGNSAYLQKTGQKQSQLYVDHVKGLYKTLERIRAKYPKIPMMLCSGGGGRVDYEALKYFGEFWPSDNTEPLERVFIQWEYSYFYPAISVCNHVTDWGKQPLKYRTDVAMMGKIGYDIIANDLNEKDLKFTQEALANYKSISDMVWHGDQYRLASPRENPFASLMYVNENKSRAVQFNYRTGQRFEAATFAPIRMKGLDPNKKYSLKELNVYPGTTSTISTTDTFSGDYLMTVGFNPDVNARRTSVLLEVNEVK